MFIGCLNLSYTNYVHGKGLVLNIDSEGRVLYSEKRIGNNVK